MLVFVYITLFAITPFVMMRLLRLAGEHANRISLITVTVYSLYAFSVLGTFPLFFMLDETRVNIGVIKQDVVLYVLMYSISCIIFLLFGVIYARRVLALKYIPIFSANIKRISQRRTMAATVVFVFVLVVLYLYSGKVGEIAIFVVFRDTLADAAIVRSDMGNNLAGGGAHWYSLILNNVGLLLTCSFYAVWLINKKTINLCLFAISFLSSSFVAVMSIEKAPFVNLIASLLMTFYFIRNDGFIPFKRLMYFVIAATGILVVFYMMFTGAETVGEALSNLLSRAFSGSITPAYFYLEYYPSQSGYLMGRTFPNPAGIMPYVPVQYTVDLMNWVFPGLSAGGVVGSMPTVFWAEAYINFGSIGVIVVSFILGILLAFILFFVSRLELNPITIGFNVWMIDHYRKMAQTGFSGYLYDFYFWGVSFFVLSILLISGSIILKSAK